VDGGGAHRQVRVGVQRDRLARMLLAHVLKHLAQQSGVNTNQKRQNTSGRSQ
jgi:hypothetical protein